MKSIENYNIHIDIKIDNKVTTLLQFPSSYDDLINKIYNHCCINRESESITTIIYENNNQQKVELNNELDYLNLVINVVENKEKKLTLEVTTKVLLDNNWKLFEQDCQGNFVENDAIIQSVIIGENDEDIDNNNNNNIQIVDEENNQNTNEKEIDQNNKNSEVNSNNNINNSIDNKINSNNNENKLNSNEDNEEIINNLKKNFAVFNNEANKFTKEAFCFFENNFYKVAEKLNELNISEKLSATIKKIPDSYNNIIDNITVAAAKPTLIKPESIKENKNLDSKRQSNKKDKTCKKKLKKIKTNKLIKKDSKLSYIDSLKKKVANKIKKEIKTYLNDIYTKSCEEAISESNKLIDNIYNDKMKELNEAKLNYDNLNYKTQSIINTHCVECKKVFKNNILYKCSICNNFDICEDCEEKLYISHDHQFIKIRLNINHKEHNQKINKINLNNNEISIESKLSNSLLNKYENQADSLCKEYVLGKDQKKKVLKALIKYEGDVIKTLESLF